MGFPEEIQIREISVFNCLLLKNHFVSFSLSWLMSKIGRKNDTFIKPSKFFIHYIKNKWKDSLAIHVIDYVK